MTYTEHRTCARGCTRRGQHLPDCPTDTPHHTDCRDDDCDGCRKPCTGCLPRTATHGVLCGWPERDEDGNQVGWRGCYGLLAQLLGPVADRESIAGCALWLADNLGQHIRAAQVGKSAPSAHAGEHFVTVASIMSDIQISLAEMSEDFREAHCMSPLRDNDPSLLAGNLRSWIDTVAAWEPIADHIDHKLELRGLAHAAVPWRGTDPRASDHAAVMIYHLPPEPTEDICQRFAIKPTWLRWHKWRGDITPEAEGVRPLYWRPWDVFRLLHPAEARHYETRLEQAS